jgi:hypothetical protein
LVFCLGPLVFCLGPFGILFRPFGILFRPFDIQFRPFGVLFRSFGILFRPFGVLFRSFGILFRPFGIPALKLFWGIIWLSSLLTELHEEGYSVYTLWYSCSQNIFFLLVLTECTWGRLLFIPFNIPALKIFFFISFDWAFMRKVILFIPFGIPALSIFFFISLDFERSWGRLFCLYHLVILLSKYFFFY